MSTRGQRSAARNVSHQATQDDRPIDDMGAATAPLPSGTVSEQPSTSPSLPTIIINNDETQDDPADIDTEQSQQALVSNYLTSTIQARRDLPLQNQGIPTQPNNSKLTYLRAYVYANKELRSCNILQIDHSTVVNNERSATPTEIGRPNDTIDIDPDLRRTQSQPPKDKGTTSNQRERQRAEDVDSSYLRLLGAPNRT